MWIVPSRSRTLAKVQARIRLLRKRGKGEKTILNTLLAEGIPNPEGREWTTTSVRRLANGSLKPVKGGPGHHREVVIPRLVELWQEGHGLGGTADRLNREGLRGENGGYWYHTSVHRMLVDLKLIPPNRSTARSSMREVENPPWISPVEPASEFVPPSTPANESPDMKTPKTDPNQAQLFPASTESLSDLASCRREMRAILEEARKRAKEAANLSTQGVIRWSAPKYSDLLDRIARAHVASGVSIRVLTEGMETKLSSDLPERFPEVWDRYKVKTPDPTPPALSVPAENPVSTPGESQEITPPPPLLPARQISSDFDSILRSVTSKLPQGGAALPEDQVRVTLKEVQGKPSVVAELLKNLGS